MKRAELIIGKAYFLAKNNDWNDGYNNGYRPDNYVNLTRVAREYTRHKVIIIETQLKTEYDRKYHTRDVLVRRNNGDEQWVSLSHIRGEFVSCIKTIYKVKGWIDTRDQKHQAHLRRKVVREQYQPAVKELNSLIAQLTGQERFNSYIDDFGYRETYKNWKLETVLAVVNAIKAGMESGIKTELKSVA